IHYGRTKAESLVENVFAPHSTEELLGDLKNSKPFFIASDASNKGNVKCFPLMIKYFDKHSGIKEGLLDFYEDPNETADGVTERIYSILEEHDLSMKNVVSYTADNAAVNYGKQKSVLAKTKLLQVNCNCHVLRNMAKHVCKLLKYDVEGLVIKVVNDFLSSAKRLEALKDCFDFVEQEYCSLLWHVPTRWLSLLSAIDRLLKTWKSLKAYFLSQAEEETHPVIWTFVAANRDYEVATQDDLSLPECSYISLVATGINVLESEVIQITEVYGVMDRLRSSLQQRIQDRFYGYKVNQCLKKLSTADQKCFRNEAAKF
uniref:DUF4371 domain-containing protein n=1 Tax=Latimeria chalumnae TaxID=7897 RepID=H3AQW2_LATCH